MSPAGWRAPKRASLALALVVLVVALFSISGCSDKAHPDYAKRKPLSGFVWARGESMRPVLNLPLFPAATLVPVELFYPFEDLKVGDIVVFYDYFTGGYIIHQLVAKQGGNWIAQGANPVTNPNADRPWVTKDNFVGLYVGPRNSP